ncbi:MAG: flavodoxin family protein [Coriobacteriia bacterium]|nr:flavodoxin family protein [Coriobacteriia bacterium]
MSDGGPPRVLCIAGSPRRHGNSERLLGACADGIREAGGEPDVLIAAEAGVRPCRGCNTCSRTGACIITDDGMSDVYRRIDASDAIIIASPVYFATVPAVLKTVYDRLQPYWARVYRLGQPRPARRPGAMLLVRSGGDPFGFGAAVDTTRSVFAVLGIDCLEELRVQGPDAPRDVLEYPAELDRAARIGAGVAATARRR